MPPVSHQEFREISIRKGTIVSYQNASSFGTATTHASATSEHSDEHLSSAVSPGFLVFPRSLPWPALGFEMNLGQSRVSSAGLGVGVAAGVAGVADGVGMAGRARVVLARARVKVRREDWKCILLVFFWWYK